MAFALPTAGDRLNLKLYFTDIRGQDSKRDVEIPFDTDIATTLANALAVAALYAAVTGAKCEKGTVIVPLFDAVAAAAVTGSEVSQDAQLSVTLDITGTSKTPTGIISFPAPLDAVRVATTGKQSLLVNTGQADIVALYTAFTAGNEATVSDGQVATALDAGKIWPRKRRPKVS